MALTGLHDFLATSPGESLTAGDSRGADVPSPAVKEVSAACDGQAAPLIDQMTDGLSEPVPTTPDGQGCREAEAPISERSVAERYARLLPMIRSRARAIGALDRDDVEQELCLKAWTVVSKFATRCTDTQLRNLVSHAVKCRMVDLIRRASREPQTVEWLDDYEADDEQGAVL